MSHGRKELVESLRAVQSLPGLKNSMDPLGLVDKALGNYICRRRALPCANGHCLTYDLLNQVSMAAFLSSSKKRDIQENNSLKWLRKIQNDHFIL